MEDHETDSGTPGGPDADPETSARDLGAQPLAVLMVERGLRPMDLVRASPDQLTHKMVSRAMKGRRLTPNSQRIVQRALQAATGEAHALPELFNYVSPRTANRPR